MAEADNDLEDEQRQKFRSKIVQISAYLANETSNIEPQTDYPELNVMLEQYKILRTCSQRSCSDTLQEFKLKFDRWNGYRWTKEENDMGNAFKQEIVLVLEEDFHFPVILIPWWTDALTVIVNQIEGKYVEIMFENIMQRILNANLTWRNARITRPDINNEIFTAIAQSPDSKLSENNGFHVLTKYTILGVIHPSIGRGVYRIVVSSYLLQKNKNKNNVGAPFYNRIRFVSILVFAGILRASDISGPVDFKEGEAYDILTKAIENPINEVEANDILQMFGHEDLPQDNKIMVWLRNNNFNETVINNLNAETNENTYYGPNGYGYEQSRAVLNYKNQDRKVGSRREEEEEKKGEEEKEEEKGEESQSLREQLEECRQKLAPFLPPPDIKDLPLREIEDRIKNTAARMTADQGENEIELEREMANLLAAMELNAEYKRRKERENDAFVDSQLGKAEEAYNEMRALYTPDSRIPTNLKSYYGLGKISATGSILKLLNVSPDVVVGTHYADLQKRYALSEHLDITEMRAIWWIVKDIEFKADKDGNKEKWRQQIIDRLKQLVKKEENDTLSDSEQQNSVYWNAEKREQDRVRKAELRRAALQQRQQQRKLAETDTQTTRPGRLTTEQPQPAQDQTASTPIARRLNPELLRRLEQLQQTQEQNQVQPTSQSVTPVRAEFKAQLAALLNKPR